MKKENLAFEQWFAFLMFELVYRPILSKNNGRKEREQPNISLM